MAYHAHGVFFPFLQQRKDLNTGAIGVVLKINGLRGQSDTTKPDQRVGYLCGTFDITVRSKENDV